MGLSIHTSFKAIFLLLSVIVACYALGYYWIFAQVTDSDVIPVKLRSLNSILVYSHLSGGALALLLGALQLFTRKGSRWHRQFGFGYCLGVLVGGIGGGYLSFFADEGPSTCLGFFILDILWLYSTFMAVQYARARQIDQHHRWITRSLALTAAAISLRLEFLVYMQFWNERTSYLIVAWSCWMGNLLVAELYLHFSSRTPTRPKGNLSL